MRQYNAFLWKELMEFTRTYKLMIIFAVFFILGMMNPLTAKLTPTLIENLMPEGMVIDIGEPTAVDSWIQFYKNVPQMGLIVVALLFGGMVSNEYTKDTLVNVMTKGISGTTIILAKFTVAVAMWSAAFWCCFTVSWCYTRFFWKDDLPYVFFAAFCLWIFGTMLISVIMMGSTLWANSYGSLLGTVFFVAILFVIGIIPKAAKYNPLSLASNNMTLLQGTADFGDFKWNILIGIALTVMFVFISCRNLKLRK